MKKEIIKLIEENIDNEKYFIVDIHIHTLKDVIRIKLSVDSDAGINIDECAAISRDINKLLQESELANDYELEVTSPGIGEPLKTERQYLKNVGRLVKVTTNENIIISGKLITVVLTEKIVVEEQKREKHKLVTFKTSEIPFINIKKTIVEISFN